MDRGQLPLSSRINDMAKKKKTLSAAQLEERVKNIAYIAARSIDDVLIDLIDDVDGDQDLYDEIFRAVRPVVMRILEHWAQKNGHFANSEGRRHE